jgi:hypothetical protein
MAICTPRGYMDHTDVMISYLKAQVINTIDDTYLNGLRNKYTGYLGVSTRNLFDHALNRYSKIAPADIAYCK